MAIGNRIAAYLTVISLLSFAGASVAEATMVDILANHGASDPASGTIINSTNAAGTADTFDNTYREAHNLLDGNGLSGTPFSQASQWADASAAYWNSQAPSTRGDLGLLIDLGGLYEIDAIQLFGYNIIDGGGIYGDRTPGSFSIWTATNVAAATTASGVLLVNDIGMFAQQGATQGMSDPGAASTFGETFLFGDATQPTGVSGTSHVVTASTVMARYLFLRDLTPIETSATDLNIVGLGEVQVYGTVVPEPGTAFLLGAGLIGLAMNGRRRRR